MCKRWVGVAAKSNWANWNDKKFSFLPQSLVRDKMKIWNGGQFIGDVTACKKSFKVDNFEKIWTFEKFKELDDCDDVRQNDCVGLRGKVLSFHKII